MHKYRLFAWPVSMLAAGVASAQVSTPNAAPAPSGQVEEVVVTATRTAVDLQKVAATVEVVSADTLQAMDITSALQLPDVTPGLVMTPSGGNNAYLRGIGSASTGYNEAQVAIYVDGLYMANPAMGISSFNNIEQVEVLKGPQGTLYGRNATGGLIAVTTRDPGTTRQVDASVGYGNYQTDTESLYASTPFSDTLAGNIAIYHSQQEQGWGTNLFNGNESQLGKETEVQSKLVWRPLSEAKVTGNIIYDTNDRNLGYAYEVLPGTVANDGTTFTDKYRANSRIDPRAPFTSFIGSLKIEYDLGFADFRSLTGYQRSHQTVLFSPAAGPGFPISGQAAAADNFIQRDRNWSQEFTLTSKPSSLGLDWIAGAYLYKDDTTLDLQSWTTCIGNVCAPGAAPNDNTGYPTTRSTSVFGDATYKFFAATHATLGLRYTDENKGLTGLVMPLAGFPNSVAALPATTVTYPGQSFAGFPNGIPTTLNFTKLTYRAVLAQDFGENTHAYISDNLGFKSGAFNGNLFTNSPVLPEVLKAYEIGVKTELFDKRVRLNASYFYYDYTNVQVRSTAPPAPSGNAILENAASERQKGLDVDFNIAVTDSFSINGGGEILSSKYRDFPGTVCSTPATSVVNGKTVGTPISVPCNLAGYDTPFSPPKSGFIGFRYKFDTSIGSWILVVNNTYNASYSMVGDNTVRQGSHNIVDASLSWASEKKDFDARLYARNLTHQYTYVVAFANGGGSYYITPGAPAIFGINVGYHF